MWILLVTYCLNLIWCPLLWWQTEDHFNFRTDVDLQWAMKHMINVYHFVRDTTYSAIIIIDKIIPRHVYKNIVYKMVIYANCQRCFIRNTDFNLQTLLWYCNCLGETFKIHVSKLPFYWHVWFLHVSTRYNINHESITCLLIHSPGMYTFKGYIYFHLLNWT